MNHISLSISGFCISYHQGVMKGLQNNKLINHNTKFYGTSGGAVTSLLTQSGISPDLQLSLTKEVLEKSITDNICVSNLAKLYLTDYLPDDCHIRCNNSVHTNLYKITWPLPYNYTIHNYDNKKDVIDAILATCYIPFVTGDDLFWTFRGQKHLDSGWLKQNMLPFVNEPNTLHIAAATKEHLSKHMNHCDIYIGMNNLNTISNNDLSDLSYNLSLDSSSFCDKLFSIGVSDVNFFCDHNLIS